MEKVKKYTQFLTDLSDAHPNHPFLESVSNAFSIIFESEGELQVKDSSQADQLSAIVKNIHNIDKEEQNDIYRKFIGINTKGLIPHQSLVVIFNKVKQMLVELSEGRIGVNHIMEYLGQFV